MARRSVEAEFLRPLSFDDEYDAILWLERMGFTSITWAFEIISSGECHVRGRVVAVNLDDHGRSTALADDVRELLRAG